eukprot:401899-Rhodomonas_salina.2
MAERLGREQELGHAASALRPAQGPTHRDLELEYKRATYPCISLRCCGLPVLILPVGPDENASESVSGSIIAVCIMSIMIKSTQEHHERGGMPRPGARKA